MDPTTKKEFTGENVMKDYGSKTEQNKKHRDYMEDFVDIYEDYLGDPFKALLMLFDGHSGKEVATESIDKFPDIFNRILDETKYDVIPSLIKSFSILDSHFTKYEEVGSTACVVYLCVENKIRVAYMANCGDSRCVLVKKNTAERLSYDHKAIDKDEIKRVKKAGGMFFRGRLGGSLAITRSLGDYSFKKEGGFGLISEPYTLRIEIENDDLYIIMASDGIWDVIDEPKLYSIVSENLGLEPKILAGLIIETSIELGSKDNLSCIAVRLN
jgi:serine/threonine protein phosphatase PrpC